MTQSVAITAFHRNVFAAAKAATQAGITMAQKMNALVTARYGDTSPTFEQYREDQRALAQLAKDRGLVDNQWVRKPYALAITSRYGALPVSMEPAAVLKRAQREAEQAAKQGQAGADGKAGKPGAVKGATTARMPSDGEALEALITRIGVFKALDACIAILAADKSTQAQAAHLKAQSRKAAELAAAATAEPAAPAKKGARTKGGRTIADQLAGATA